MDLFATTTSTIPLLYNWHGYDGGGGVLSVVTAAIWKAFLGSCFGERLVSFPFFEPSSRKSPGKNRCLGQSSALGTPGQWGDT